MTTLQKTSYAIQQAFKSVGMTVSRGKIQEIIASGFGYGSLAAYQASPEEDPGIDAADYVLLDTAAMKSRAAALGVTPFPVIEIIPIFNKTAAPIVAVSSFEDFADEIRPDVMTKILIEDGRVASAIAETNADNGDIDPEFEEPVDSVADAQDFWEVPVSGQVQLDQDPEKPFSGDAINIDGVVRFTKVGRRCVRHMELDISAAVDDSYYVG
ncbi:MAG: hypothetical protein WCV99_06195 [Sterolibacterium sp.]|jgi:hypothetical protein